MADEIQPKTGELTPRETAAILLRILDDVENKERKRWIDITCAVVLSLATVGSAWCAYQSALWSGVQTFRIAESNRLGREASMNAMTALQFRGFDAQMLFVYLEAKSRGDEKMAAMLQSRFRPDAKQALDAWLKTDPFSNPNAPKSLFLMSEYAQPERDAASRLEEESARKMEAAQKANQAGDRYVLLTVLFATVLFSGGIGSTVQSRRVRWVLFVISVVLFAMTVIAVATMPICRE
ncbi:MAG: hypothetical protein U0791_01850 [Gemmataceae bacterium]